MNYSQWLLQKPTDTNLLNTHPLISELLTKRGILTDEAAQKFMHPAYEDLLDPFLFGQMREAVHRVWQAIDKNEEIAVYADYDADAVTAAAVMLRGLQHLGVEAGSYIPDRFTEGYGLNIEAFEKLKNDGAKVVITVDCGTNSVDVAQWCLKNDITLIITDHHEVTGELPQAFALVNPKSPEEGYPDKQLTGAGVAFKFMQALFGDEARVRHQREQMGQDYIKNWEKWLLDTAAIGTVADCHSLLGENRIIVKFGLQVLAKTKWPGLSLLIKKLGLGAEKKLDARSIGFQIAPRINAAGRLEHAKVALDLLMAEDNEESEQLLENLESVNLRRQGLTERIAAEAFEQAALQPDREVLILSGTDWHRGVVGIVAGRVAERFGKPSIVLGQVEETWVGSARSRANFNVVECLKYASTHLLKFGGHTQAAGLTLSLDNLENFTRLALEFAREQAGDWQESGENILELDAELKPSLVNLEVAQLLQSMEPFGVGNPEPKFLLSGCRVVNFRLVGQEQQHLKLLLDFGNVKVDAIGFNMAHVTAWLEVGSLIDVAATMNINEWNGTRKVDLKLVGLRRS